MKDYYKSSKLLILRDSTGSGRFTLASCLLLILGLTVIVLVILKFPAVKKRIPVKDPYALELIAGKRDSLYNDLKINPSPSTMYEIASTSFQQGEIYEAEYFMGKVGASVEDKENLKEKLKKYKETRDKLENYLYSEKNYYNEPFVYTAAYFLIDEILKLSETGYLRVRHKFLKGYLLLKEGRRTEARRIFDDLIDNGGVFSETSLYMYAKSFMDDQNKKDGVRAFESYLMKYPDSRLAPLAVHYLATIHMENKEFDKSLQLVKSAIAKYPQSEYIPELLLTEESILKITSQVEWEKSIIDVFKNHTRSSVVFKRSLELYEEWENSEKKTFSDDLSLEICRVLIENGRLYQSKKMLDAVKKNLPKDKTAYADFIMAKRQKGVGEYDSSIKECKNAIDKTKDKNLKSSIYALMGEVYGLKKDVSSAEKYYVLSGKEKGNLSDYALREVGRIAYKNGWRNKAETYYSDIVENYPDSVYMSEALNYLIVLAAYNKKDAEVEKYAKLLKEKGTDIEDRLKGDYFLKRLAKTDEKYTTNYPLAYYSLIVKKQPAKLYKEPEEAYPDVTKHKYNMGWEFFLAGCFDLAARELEFINDDNPYSRMVLAYLAFLEKGPHHGIIATRNLTGSNQVTEIEQGYAEWFYKTAYPIRYLEEIKKLSVERNFPISFFLAIIRQESFFKEKVKSSAGAIGLMQIMPSTGKWIAEKLNESKGYKHSNLEQPNTNLKYGAWYQSHLREQLGNEYGMILAGHNGGPGNVRKWKEMFPIYDKDKYLFYEMIPAMETRNFIRHVLVNQRIYELLLENEGKKVHF